MKIKEQQLYNAAHHILLASAWAVKVVMKLIQQIKLGICLQEVHGIHIHVILKMYLQQLQKNRDAFFFL